MLAEKYPQAYFGGAVALAKTIRWDTGTEEMFDGALTPDEIMDKLEERVGPEGRKLFERFLRDVNKLGAQRQFGGAGTDGRHRTLRRTGAGLAASRCEDEPLGRQSPCVGSTYISGGSF
jgi:hypothetical protein